MSTDYNISKKNIIIKKIIYHRWDFAYVGLLFLCVETLASLSLFQAFKKILSSPLWMLINIVVIGLFFIILRNLIKNKYVSGLILLGMTLLLGIATYIKYTYRGTGPSPQDFQLIKEALQMSSVLSFDVFLKIGLLSSLFVGTAIFVLRKTNDIIPSLPNRLVRVGLALVSLFTFCFISLLLNERESASPLSQTVTEKGVYMYFFSQMDRETESKAHKTSQTNEVLKQSIEDTFNPILKDGEVNQSTSSKPDIVFIQSESFFDPTEILGIENFSEDPLPFYHNLKAESDYFKVTSPAFGGDTANAEFETLTGLTLTTLPKDTNVFVSYLNKPITSLASILRAQGYDAQGIHPYTGNFYNRNGVYSHLGFNSFSSLETMTKEDADFKNRAFSFPQSAYASDKELTYQVMKALENKKEKQQFIFAISVQTHTPFEANKNMNYNASYIGENQFNKLAINEFNGYLRNLQETDESLRILIEYLKNRKKETLLVFYGDHQPRLSIFPYSEGMDLKEKQAFHEVPAFIWSNKKTLTTSQSLIDMTLLGEKALSTASLDMPRSFYFLRTLRDSGIESFNKEFMIKKGTYYLKDSPEYETIAKAYQLMFEDQSKATFYIEKGNQDWIIKDNIEYKNSIKRNTGGG